MSTRMCEQNWNDEEDENQDAEHGQEVDLNQNKGSLSYLFHFVYVDGVIIRSFNKGSIKEWNKITQLKFSIDWDSRWKSRVVVGFDGVPLD